MKVNIPKYAKPLYICVCVFHFNIKPPNVRMFKNNANMEVSLVGFILRVYFPCFKIEVSCNLAAFTSSPLGSNAPYISCSNDRRTCAD